MWELGALPILLFGAPIAYVIYLEISFRLSHGQVPIARGHLPLLGSLLAIVKSQRNNQFHRFLEASLDGRDAVKMSVLGRTIVIVNTPQAALSISRKPEVVTPLEAFGEAGRSLAPDSTDAMINLWGDEWRRHRVLAQPFFAPSFLALSEAVVSSKTEVVASHWRSLVEKAGASAVTVDVQKALSSITLDTAGQFLFSFDYGRIVDFIKGGDDSEASRKGRELAEGLEMIGQVVMNRLSTPKPLWWTLKDEAACRKAVAAVHAPILAMVARRRSGEDGKLGKHDLLQVLIDAGERAELPFSDQEIRDEIVSFTFAGTDTTANTLGFAMAVLGSRPALQQRLVDESRASAAAEDTSARSTPLLDAFIKEVQRLYPVAYFMGRGTREAVEIDGVGRIEKNVDLFTSIRTLHRSEKLWGADALAFDESRWLDQSRLPPRGAFLPFGEGAKSCIGSKLAMIEMRAILPILLRDLVFESSEPIDDITVFTLQPRSVTMNITARR